jgi:methyl-accepting chemotaxis protein
MKWFINLPTRGKLTVGFGFMWLLLAGTIVADYLIISEISNSAKDLHDVHYATALDLIELRAHQNYNRGLILELMIITDKVAREAIEKDISDHDKQIEGGFASIARLNPDPDFLRRIEELEELTLAYRRARDQGIPLIRAGRIDEARLLGSGEQERRFEEIRSLAMELSDKAKDDAERQLASNMLTARRSIQFFILFGVIAFALGTFMVVRINGAIAKPMSELNELAESMASGDLSLTPISIERKDEVGVLARSFYRMASAMRDIAGIVEQIASGDLRVAVTPQSEKDMLGNAVAKMTENLHKSTATLTESISCLGSSASEILAATTQVASGTAEIAAAISQTTATVEEVRQAARLSSEKAKAVSDNAQRVSETSQSGQKAVEDTAADMIRIHDQMESIAQTIVRLSEQGQSIGGIIASVTDLADQSNLLAVNAAIEAARAGEQGKGFTVVAQEIRSLAEQSKQATAQIREILNDIQKATSAAVMATEQGSKAVEAGVKQSAQAGEAIRALADGTAEAAQAAIQIVASSQQQVIGMDQIGIAMENINQAGAQTAASMRQTETAAQDLHELGRKLKVLVDQYRT